MSEAAATQPVPEAGVEPDGIDSVTLLLWGFVSVVITIALMFAAAALYFQQQGRLNVERIESPSYFETEKTIADQLGVLTSYGAPAAEGQPYKIPIDEAKSLVLAELQDK